MKFLSVVAQTIKAKRVQWLVYCAIGFGFLLLYISIFPSIQSQAANYGQILSSLPKGLTVALNITDSTPSLLSYLSSKHFGLVWLLMIIMFVIAFASFAIAREVETKTMAFLMSQPIKRWTFYLSRLSAGVIGLIIFVLTTELVTIPLAHLFNFGINTTQTILIGLGGFLFGLAVLCLSMMFSAFSKSGGKVSALSGIVMLAFYALFIIASLSPDLDNLKYFSLFHYFSPGDIVKNNNLAWTSIVVFIGFSIITTLIGLIGFKKREIQT